MATGAGPTSPRRCRSGSSPAPPRPLASSTIARGTRFLRLPRPVPTSGSTGSCEPRPVPLRIDRPRPAGVAARPHLTADGLLGRFVLHELEVDGLAPEIDRLFDDA